MYIYIYIYTYVVDISSPIRGVPRYAKAGYDKALERADQAWAARSLLDSGSPAQEAPVSRTPGFMGDKIYS